MKKSLKPFAAICLSIGLIVTNLPSVSVITAEANSSAPTIEEVTAEAQKTASYMMSIADYTVMQDSSSFYNATKNLYFSIRSGLDCQSHVDAYKTALDMLLNADGTLNIPVNKYGYPSDLIGCQAYMIATLSAAGLEPSNFNGKDAIAGLSALLKNKTDLDFKSTNMNPYYLGILNTIVTIYEHQIQDSREILRSLKLALDSIFDTRGVYYYGHTADNNGTVLPGFTSYYNTDTNFRDRIEHAVTYSMQRSPKSTYDTVFDNTTGDTSILDDQGSLKVSSDSTALSTAFYGAFDKPDMAAKSYYALLTFASTKIPGGYTHSGQDSIYSSASALTGLVSYQYALSGIANVYDITQTLDSTDNSEPEEPTTSSEIPETPTEEDSAAATPTEEDSSVAPPTADPHTQAAIFYLLAAMAALTAVLQYYNKKHNIL